jgi:hypothetical protein
MVSSSARFGKNLMSMAPQLFGRTDHVSCVNAALLFAALFSTGQAAKPLGGSVGRPASGRLPLSLEAAYSLTDVIIVSAGLTIEIFPKTFTDQSFISSSAGRGVDRMPTFNPDLQQLNSDSRRACLQSTPGCHDASRRPSQYEATP